MIICVTGVPGTGKSSIVKMLEKELAKKFRVITLNGESFPKAITGFDEKRKCKIVDTRIYEKELKKFLKEKQGFDIILIDSLFCQELSPNLVSLCVVLRCDEQELRKRLEKRGYSEEKIKENIEAELCNSCGQEAFEKKHEFIEINTSNKSVREVANKVLHKINTLLT